MSRISNVAGIAVRTRRIDDGGVYLSLYFYAVLLRQYSPICKSKPTKRATLSETERTNLVETPAGDPKYEPFLFIKPEACSV